MALIQEDLEKIIPLIEEDLMFIIEDELGLEVRIEVVNTELRDGESSRIIIAIEEDE